MELRSHCLVTGDIHKQLHPLPGSPASPFFRWMVMDEMSRASWNVTSGTCTWVLTPQRRAGQAHMSNQPLWLSGPQTAEPVLSALRWPPAPAAALW